MESQKIQSFFVPSDGNSWRFIEADDDLVKAPLDSATELQTSMESQGSEIIQR